MNRRRIVLMLAATIGLSWTADRHAAGFTWFQSGGVNVVWSGNQSTRYLSPSTFPPGSDPDTHILAGMGLWNIVPAANFEYFFIRPTQDFPIDHGDGFNDTIAVPAASLDPGVLAVTTLVNNGPVWFDMDIEFSDFPEGAGYTFDPNPDCQIITNPTPTNGFSFLLIAAHELGHALGLGHDPVGNEPPGTPWFIGTMNPRYPDGGPVGQENIIELHTDDRSGLRFLYPPSGPSGQPVIDLAHASYTSSSIIGKSIPVFFTPTTVLPGDIVTARSVIENFGSTSELFVRQGFYLSTDPIIATTDTLLGSLTWDLAFEDAIDFDVDIDMPADLAAGTYYLGSIFDDLNAIPEDFEDNNAVLYCEPLVVDQLPPAINNILQETATCGQGFIGPLPTVTHPLNMGPITWSLDNPQPGMIINAVTGILIWPNPIPSPFQYQVFLRATNAAGTATQSMLIGVSPAAPQIVFVPDATISPCAGGYVGPTPVIVNPTCMNPILNWSLDIGPPGMTIDFATGIVTWPAPVLSAAPYPVAIRATNAAGNGTRSWSLSVIAGDTNGDAVLSLADLSGFVNILLGLNPGQVFAADLNCDGFADGGDIQTFVDLLISAP